MKIPFIKIDKVDHIIIGLMIFLWSWNLTDVYTAFWITLAVAILKEIFDRFAKIPLLKWLLKKGFYDTTVGLFLEKNRFIMPRKNLPNAVPLFDFWDIVATVAIPLLILIIKSL